jgi:hypothetical protein
MAGQRGHRWVKYVFLSWSVCGKCGLVALRNDRTAAAIRARCPGDDDA